MLRAPPGGDSRPSCGHQSHLLRALGPLQLPPHPSNSAASGPPSPGTGDRGVCVWGGGSGTCSTRRWRDAGQRTPLPWTWTLQQGARCSSAQRRHVPTVGGKPGGCLACCGRLPGCHISEGVILAAACRRANATGQSSQLRLDGQGCTWRRLCSRSALPATLVMSSPCTQPSLCLCLCLSRPPSPTHLRAAASPPPNPARRREGRRGSAPRGPASRRRPARAARRRGRTCAGARGRRGGTGRSEQAEKQANDLL